MKLNIDVTEKFINKGKRACSSTCPIGLAVEEAFCRRLRTASFTVIILQGKISVINHTKKGRIYYGTKTPVKAQRFMTLFDNSPNKINTPPPVKPFKITLNLKREKYSLEKHESIF